MEKKNKILLAIFSSFLVNSCGVTKEWTGNSMPRNNQAIFGHFSGKQEFKMNLFGADTLSRFRYHFNIEKGTVQIRVKQGEKTLLDLKDLAEVEDELIIENKGVSEIAVVLRGKDAKGLYNMTITKAN